MPIFVTVQPDQHTGVETIMYANGMPMLAVHDASASVMFTADPTVDSARLAGEWAGRLLRAARQFEHECFRFTDPHRFEGRDFANSGPGLDSLSAGATEGGGR